MWHGVTRCDTTYHDVPRRAGLILDWVCWLFGWNMLKWRKWRKWRSWGVEVVGLAVWEILLWLRNVVTSNVHAPRRETGEVHGKICRSSTVVHAAPCTSSLHKRTISNKTEQWQNRHHWQNDLRYVLSLCPNCALIVAYSSGELGWFAVNSKSSSQESPSALQCLQCLHAVPLVHEIGQSKL